MASSRLKIGLLWHSANSGNLGVGALTLANMALARQAATDVGLTADFVIIGMRDGDQAYVTDAEASVLVVDTKTLLSPKGCWAVLGDQDVVLDIGAGDSFADIYGLKRFLFLWLTKMIAVARRTPLILSPQTIGPFTRSPYRQLAKVALEASTTVVARDEVSLDVLRKLAPSANALLSADVAFALPFEDRSPLRGGLRRRIGVNVSGLLFNEAVSGSNRFGLSFDYAALMRRFIGDLAGRDDAEVHLIPHATARAYAWDDDGRVADLLAAEFPSVVRVTDFAGPSQAKSYISGLDFLVAGRMHACIGAFSAGTPVVPVAYSRKFSGLFGMLDYPWIVPVNGVTTDQALAIVHDGLERRAELAADTRRGLSKVDALLETYRAELRLRFDQARPRP